MSIDVKNCPCYNVQIIFFLTRYFEKHIISCFITRTKYFLKHRFLEFCRCAFKLEIYFKFIQIQCQKGIMWTKFDGVISAKTNQAFSSEKSGEKTRTKSFIDRLNITGPSLESWRVHPIILQKSLCVLSEHTVYGL